MGIREGLLTGCARTGGLLCAVGLLASPGCQDGSDPEGDGASDASTSAESGEDPSGGGTTLDTDTADSSSGGEVVDPNAPTWYADVAPLVTERCTGCHTDGGIAPFSFDDYTSTAALAEVIAASVESRTMPPWGAQTTEACGPTGDFLDDISLNDAEIDLLRSWSDAGAPEGDPADAVALPPPPATELENVDQVLQIASPVTMDGIKDEFVCFSLDPGLDEQRFFRGMQIVPGNDKIVHHVLVYLDESGASAEEAGEDGQYPCSGGGQEGDLVGVWAPGSVPMQTPDDLGMRVPAGSRLVLNVHYHPTGLGPEVDSSTGIELDWMDETPSLRGELVLVGNTNDPDELLPNDGDQGGTPEFRIPAGASGHLEEMRVPVPASTPNVSIWSVGTHMHYVGTDMMIRLENEDDGTDKCMVHTPQYSFEWQRLYRFDGQLSQMPTAKGGDTVYLRCSYDNSMNNPYVAEALADQGLDEPVDVVLGEETLDEMCLGVFGIALPAGL